MVSLIQFVIDKLSAIPNVTVRNAYDTTKPEYPLITVLQMDNFELGKYTTLDTVERVSASPFQIECYARNMELDGEIVSAAIAAEHFRIVADEIMQAECGMRRTSSPPIIPHTTDDTVMRAIARYDCMIDLDSLTIFKK